MNFKIPYLRWWIAGALFLAAVLNYIDRSLLGLLAPTIQQDLGVSDAQYADIINLFLLAYTVAYLLSGWVVDKLGVRLSLALFVAWWSVSNALTGLAQSVRSLGVYRFMLGLGEAGAFTAAPKAVGEWFPPAERGIAVGVYSLGGAVGATVAPLLVALIAVNYGWRWVFAVSPLLAGGWLALWLLLYRRPNEHPRITDRERAYLATHLPGTAGAESAPPQAARSAWADVLREPFVWRLMVARMLTDPVWYFYQFWMPKYLHTVRGLDQKSLGIMWVIFLAADLGFLASGFLSGRLITGGLGAPASRLRVMAAGALLVPISFAVPLSPTVTTVIVIAMLAALGHTAWLASITSLVVDLAPKRILGTAFGFIACGSALGGIAMNKLVGWLVTNGAYDDCFYAMAFVHPLALALVWRLRGQPAAA